ncbi:hypothetical protein [Pontibacter sp. G13]|uniref:hypothetical protein n=1 Tax=Pontibacter sp. G13 TaxID=3074898 RepID=UPI00288C0A18|nr:hypothetical protein [Pontibacter sp. G13]WNJ19344.1 hypothetical protein RJD25_02530 [Pontibacter sp. G13]
MHLRTLFPLIALLCLLAPQVQAQLPPAPGTFRVMINDQEVDPSGLTHMVFCGDGNDIIEISFQPKTPPPSGHAYVIASPELWGQLQLADPIMLTKESSSLPSSRPSVKFRLSDLLSNHPLPSSAGTIRMSLQIPKLSMVNRKEEVKKFATPKDIETIPFMVLPKCYSTP